MLNKIILSCIALLTSSLVLSKTPENTLNLLSLQKIENMVLSCPQMSEDINDSIILRCYTNGHNIIKKNINTEINKLKNKDKTSLLNMKGLDFEIIRFSCKKSYSDIVLIKECEVYTDLAYLDYIVSRYY